MSSITDLINLHYAENPRSRQSKSAISGFADNYDPKGDARFKREQAQYGQQDQLLAAQLQEATLKMQERQQDLAERKLYLDTLKAQGHIPLSPEENTNVAQIANDYLGVNASDVVLQSYGSSTQMGKVYSQANKAKKSAIADKRSSQKHNVEMRQKVYTMAGDMANADPEFDGSQVARNKYVQQASKYLGYPVDNLPEGLPAPVVEEEPKKEGFVDKVKGFFGGGEAADNGKVKIILPNGSLKMIPKENLDKAIKRGAKLAS